MKGLRKYLTPLATDSLATLDLPPVRVGLLTKLNVLTIGLIVLTGVATSAFYVSRQWYGEDDDVRARGEAVAAMLAAVAEYGPYPANRAQIERLLDGLAAGGDVAYVSVIDAAQNVLVERRFTAALEGAPIPPAAAPGALPAPGRTTVVDNTIGGQRHVEVIAPIVAGGAAAERAARAGAASRAAAPAAHTARLRARRHGVGAHLPAPAQLRASAR